MTGRKTIYEAVVSHGYRICTDVDPQSEMEKDAEMLGVQVSALIIDTISGMQDVAEQIGLKGTIVE